MRPLITFIHRIVKSKVLRATPIRAPCKAPGIDGTGVVGEGLPLVVHSDFVCWVVSLEHLPAESPRRATVRAIGPAVVP